LLLNAKLLFEKKFRSQFNPLECKGNYSTMWNNMKLAGAYTGR